MSFFMVPSVSYQTQEKLKKHKKVKGTKKKRTSPTSGTSTPTKLRTSSSTKGSVTSEESNHQHQPPTSPIDKKIPLPTSEDFTNSKQQSPLPKVTEPEEDLSLKIASRFSESLNKSPQYHGMSTTASLTSLPGASNTANTSSPSAGGATATAMGITHSYHGVTQRQYLDRPQVHYVRPRSGSVYSHAIVNPSDSHHPSLSSHSRQGTANNMSVASGSGAPVITPKGFRKLSLFAKSSSPAQPQQQQQQSRRGSDVSSMHSKATVGSGNIGDTSEVSARGVPKFKPIIDLTVLNSMEEMEKCFFTPGYAIFRYNNFLALLSDNHTSDAVNFANVRNHSLLKFIVRQKNAGHLLKKKHGFEHFDIRVYESLLAYELYTSREFMRKLIKEASDNHQLYNHEELVQTNFVNYVRYLLNLPKDVKMKDLTDDERRHYEYKDLFKRIAEGLYLMKREETNDIVTNENDWALKTKLLLETITKVCYEYILLEKYSIDIFTKFHDNKIFDLRILSKIFNNFHEHMKTQNRESCKLLFFNTFYSIQYGWYIALTVPFVRVFETNVYVEDKHLIENETRYHQFAQSKQQIDFTASDSELYDTYFKKLLFSSFEEYNQMSLEKLIKILKLIDNQSPKYSRINRHEIPDPSATYSHNPMNFEYFNSGLSSIQSNTFEMVSCPDLPLQVNSANYKTILNEFHRILKIDGVFETNCLQFGSKTIHQFLERNRSGSFPRNWDYDEFNLVNYYTVMPEFVQTVLMALCDIFGKDNVTYNILLLSSNLEVNNFLINFNGLKLFELVGKFSEYCNLFEDTGESVKSDNDTSIHFMVHIKAIKTRTSLF
ncbi:uncharacterized protein J8A68_002414 [[Candida] subhashii]|uniref:Uncharacterized protein n=1 Tax=[Candida] subhashii TaxID=561895 RepID=A0A8J5UP44_9ASCO|nr:uncharacterized protein J8A68_002414 [[Candida] subhashii]KAG7664036.1 hypothetical protein J8A68_002414 [[Candida] subhashii]